MPYIKHSVGISEDKAKKLLKNLSVRLSNADLVGDIPMELTTKHMRGMGKAYQSGKGYILRISPTHHRRLVKGEGFWSDLWSKIKGAVGTVAKALKNPIVKKAVGIASNIPAVKGGIDTLAGLANVASNQIVPNLNAGDIAKGAIKSYTGSGVRRGRKPKGGSFLLQ